MPVTIKDVAKKANVSISVVSYVLNNTPGKTITEETRNRVLAAAKELHYVPFSAAKMLRSKSTQTIALISYWEVEDASFTSFLTGLMSELNKNGYSLLLSDTESTAKKTISHLCKRLIPCGVVVLPPHKETPEYNETDIKEALSPLNIPVVFLKSEATKYDDIYCDYYKTGYIAAEYLIKKGIKQLCFVKSSYHTPSEDKRLNGFLDCLESYKLKPVMTVNDDEVASIFENENINGAVASKSDTAFKIIKYAEENKIALPLRLSVVSANDEPFNKYVNPPVTAVKLPIKAIGQAAGIKILNKITDKSEPLPVIEYTIEERKSVK